MPSFLVASLDPIKFRALALALCPATVTLVSGTMCSVDTSKAGRMVEELVASWPICDGDLGVE